MEFGDVPTGTYLGGNRSGLSGFLRRTARSIMDMPWQIVQVKLTSYVKKKQNCNAFCYDYVKPIDVADFCINYKMIHMINGCFVS